MVRPQRCSCGVVGLTVACDDTECMHQPAVANGEVSTAGDGLTYDARGEISSQVGECRCDGCPIFQHTGRYELRDAASLPSLQADVD
jgi:hypothetical protein